jgi:hypothetical protein
MEIFIPSLIVLIIALTITFFVAPRATPVMAGILSLLFLGFGIYDHYTMFETEYRQSTWQTGLKVYAPAIMIGAIFLFVLLGIVSTFTGGSVPVPSMPNIPNVSNLTDNVSDLFNDVTNNLNTLTNNLANNVVEPANEAINNMAETANDALNTLMGNTNRRNNKNTSRSFLETI